MTTLVWDASPLAFSQRAPFQKWHLWSNNRNVDLSTKLSAEAVGC